MDNNDKNRNGGCVLFLFCGAFLSAGIGVMLYVAVLPLYKYAVSGSWDQVPATVMSSKLERSYSDGSTTYGLSARFRYDYAGQRYVSDTPSLYSGNDNFDDYWQSLSRRLARAQSRGETVTAWVNPADPQEAYVDRSVRMASMVFGFAFGGVFALVGGGLLWLTKKGKRQVTLDKKAGSYSSREKSGHWLMVGFGTIFVLLPSPAYMEIPKAVGRGDYPMLAVLLFPLVGIGIAVAGLRMRSRYRFFGPSPLVMDPEPGAIGGDVGGEITLQKALHGDAGITVWLSCIRGRQTGSGKNRRTVEDILWQTRQKGYCQTRSQHTSVQFCFAVPEGHQASSGGSSSYIRWRVELEGNVDGRELKRSWDIPVSQGTQKSRYQLPESHVTASEREQALEAAQSAGEQISMAQTASGLQLLSAAGRNLGMKLGLLLAGAIFGGIGVGMLFFAAQEGAVLYVMGGIFSLVGLPLAATALFMLGRGLAVTIHHGDVECVRSWFGVPIYSRTGRLLRADQVSIESTMSSTSNGKKTEYFVLLATINGRKIRLAEGVTGREAAESLQEAVLRALRLA